MSRTYKDRKKKLNKNKVENIIRDDNKLDKLFYTKIKNKILKKELNEENLITGFK